MIRADAILSRRLGAIEGFVGSTEKFILILNMGELARGGGRNAQTHGYLHGSELIAVRAMFFHNLAHFLRHKTGSRSVGLRQEHHKLLPTVSGDRITNSRMRLDDVGDRPEDRVALLMTEAIVDALEIIDVDDHTAERFLVAFRPFELLLEPGEKVSAIMESSQVVRNGELFQASLHYEEFSHQIDYDEIDDREK